MERERFDFVCQETMAGRDAFVTHHTSGEEGRVVDFKADVLVVETVNGKKRKWEYDECEEISRGKNEWPRR